MLTELARVCAAAKLTVIGMQQVGARRFEVEIVPPKTRKETWLDTNLYAAGIVDGCQRIGAVTWEWSGGESERLWVTWREQKANGN